MCTRLSILPTPRPTISLCVYLSVCLSVCLPNYQRSQHLDGDECMMKHLVPVQTNDGEGSRLGRADYTAAEAIVASMK